MMKLWNLLAVFLGGGTGAILRYLISACSFRFTKFAHYGTFLVNIVGCLIIGYIIGLLQYRINYIPHHLKIFLTVGFLGGLTTFSTFTYEVFELFYNGKYTLALIYLLASCIVGLIGVYIGFSIANAQCSI